MGTQGILDEYGLFTGRHNLLLTIYYGFPDFPKVIAPPFVWGFDDLYPQFPRLRKFINHWCDTIEAPVYRMYLDHQAITEPVEVRIADFETTIH